MAIVHTGQGVETTQQRCMAKTNLPCLLLAAGVLIAGTALSTVLHVGLAKTTDETSSTNQQQFTIQEYAHSIGCYADDTSLRIMPHVYTDDALTPLVSHIAVR